MLGPMAAIFLPPETAQPPPEEGPAEELRLFLQARTGDFLAFEELVGRLQNRVHGLALRILGPSRTHDAEDVL